MPAETNSPYGPGYRDDLIGRPPVEIPPPVSSVQTQRTLREWERLARANVIPAAAGQQDAAERLSLRKPKNNKEKNKNKERQTLYRWTQGLWLRRAVMQSRSKAQEKAKDSSSRTARGFWRMADVAIGLALNAAPNQIVIAPKNTKRNSSLRGYSKNPK